eukprot:1196064-Prorocentrum_minimum.AAC.2
MTTKQRWPIRWKIGVISELTVSNSGYPEATQKLPRSYPAFAQKLPRSDGFNLRLPGVRTSHWSAHCWTHLGATH